MEKNNETDVFGQKKQRTGHKYQAGKTAGAAVAGAAVGMAASAFATDDPEPIPDPISEPVPPIDPVPTPSSNHNPDTTNGVHQQPEPDSKTIPEPEPKETVDPEPIPDPEPEPIMPVEEIDSNDNELIDVIEDVTTVEVVYDINGNPMLVATAHNPVDGEFYLVDADMDGDFDVVLDGAGVPVVELTGENDQLITVTDVESKMTDNYTAPNEIDEMIAQNNMIDEQIQNDIIIVDDGIS